MFGIAVLAAVSPMEGAPPPAVADAATRLAQMEVRQRALFVKTTPLEAALVNQEVSLRIEPATAMSINLIAPAENTTVTLLGHVYKVEFDTGDGHPVECRATGGTFVSKDGGRCVHRHTTPSATARTIRAVVHWSISWSSAKTAGVEPIELTSEAQPHEIHVQELIAVNEASTTSTLVAPTTSTSETRLAEPPGSTDPPAPVEPIDIIVALVGAGWAIAVELRIRPRPWPYGVFFLIAESGRIHEPGWVGGLVLSVVGSIVGDWIIEGGGDLDLPWFSLFAAVVGILAVPIVARTEE